MLSNLFPVTPRVSISRTIGYRSPFIFRNFARKMPLIHLFLLALVFAPNLSAADKKCSLALSLAHRSAIGNIWEPLYHPQRFHRLSKASFMMGSPETYQVKVELKQDFEAMETLVTEKHWVDVMGDNSWGNLPRENSIPLKAGAKELRIKPNHPVSFITWWSALVYANKVSEMSGLKPVYDLRELQWKEGTSAAEGNLQAVRGELKIFANGESHSPFKEDVYYQAEGYRLPTDAEQEYLLRGGGRSTQRYVFGNEARDQLREYAWFGEFDGAIKPVAELEPIRIGETAEFYDLLGNVAEWAWDIYHPTPKGGANPTGGDYGPYRVIRGGSVVSPVKELGAEERDFAHPNKADYHLGFRLVRSLK